MSKQKGKPVSQLKTRNRRIVLTLTWASLTSVGRLETMILKATELVTALGVEAAAAAPDPRRFAAATTAAAAGFPPLPTSLAFAACAPPGRRFPALRFPCFFSAMIYCESGEENVCQHSGSCVRFSQGIRARTLSRDLSRTMADMLTSWTFFGCFGRVFGAGVLRLRNKLQGGCVLPLPPNYW